MNQMGAVSSAPAATRNEMLCNSRSDSVRRMPPITCSVGTGTISSSAAASRSATTKTRKKLAVADRPVKTATILVISTTRHVATIASVHRFACTAPTGERNRSYGIPYSNASGAVSQNSPRNARYSPQNVRFVSHPRRMMRNSTNDSARDAPSGMSRCHGSRRRSSPSYSRASAAAQTKSSPTSSVARSRAATRIASRRPRRNPNRCARRRRELPCASSTCGFVCSVVIVVVLVVVVMVVLIIVLPTT